jgi:hypothetical protein
MTMLSRWAALGLRKPSSSGIRPEMDSKRVKLPTIVYWTAFLKVVWHRKNFSKSSKDNPLRFSISVASRPLSTLRDSGTGPFWARALSVPVSSASGALRTYLSMFWLTERLLHASRGWTITSGWPRPKKTRKWNTKTLNFSGALTGLLEMILH